MLCCLSGSGTGAVACIVSRITQLSPLPGSVDEIYLDCHLALRGQRPPSSRSHATRSMPIVRSTAATGPLIDSFGLAQTLQTETGCAAVATEKATRQHYADSLCGVVLGWFPVPNLGLGKMNWPAHCAGPTRIAKLRRSQPQRRRSSANPPNRLKPTKSTVDGSGTVTETSLLI
jgi:hypothetical protein